MKSLDREIKKHNNILFVDGYNIINSWENLKSIESLEDSRRELIRIMEVYQVYTKQCVVLVFDSYNVKNDRQVVFENNLIIVFTKELETADHFIEMMAEEYGKKKSIKVATSDRVEQDIILGKGATRISAQELLILVDAANKDIEQVQEMTNIKNSLHLTGLSEESINILEEIKENMSKKR